MLLLSTGTSRAAVRVVDRDPFSDRNITRTAKYFIAKADFLGFRCLIRRAYGLKISAATWDSLRGLIVANAGTAGYDLIPLWNDRHPTGKSSIDSQLEAADSLMLARKFEEAFAQYSTIARNLKQAIDRLKLSPKNAAWVREARGLYPFVLHSMGRALYGARRYAEALIVYHWIEPGYPYFRQVLFEKMWAAFRYGRSEIALGAVASQKSAYFSIYLHPESYLLETYLFRKMCRNDDLSIAEAEIQDYQALLAKNQISNWAVNDLSSRILWRLANLDLDKTPPRSVITRAARQREQDLIKRTLGQVYLNAKPGIQKGLEMALAYSRLSSSATGAGPLKAIESFPSRDEYLKRNLEVWPSDSREDWIDEIGTHQFIGESQCEKVTK
ncbi:MAG TPA: hypothetical protein DCS07_16845 [Bdellovibrionales bacterium]|nr:MAG: hypothetical protein A2Z97_13065 [Bdellovibrionales bacterium GWB1_52_6]OFZ05762.1 MAG: hypothetical protein A2X97_03615 [Bdellovibrionales bacterium GWA1_52_35]OFZ43353.1 MAG: hypothetical protein A2070_09860 [Bdellovibrionales bacterium GWC1_52_8]HAR44273.1 hypothetical protein [Bdellovibrionales bacterium]HCM40297.1 hypothetical protein [Bdellovibrionales bacterium]